MAVITINNLLDFITLFLVLVSIVILFIIILRTDKKICTSHKFLFAGLIILGVVKILNLLLEFKMIILKLIYLNILEVIFVLLFITGFWYMHQGIKERQEIPRKPEKKLQKPGKKKK